jgi:hypothetical protein
MPGSKSFLLNFHLVMLKLSVNIFLMAKRQLDIHYANDYLRGFVALRLRGYTLET